jgi:RNA polymerase sigma-70 factor (ECF subfamily)
MTGQPEMSVEQLDQHLSQIATSWTVLFQAHAGSGDEAARALQQLLERYRTAVYRYLFASVRNAEDADELFQEFALRLVRGDFKRADPQRGRFRQFLKTSLYHLVVDHRRRRRLAPLGPDTPEPAAEADSTAESDREFLVVWQAELMNLAWAALSRFERETGEPLHTVLRFRTDHPDMRSPQMAEHLSRLLGKDVSDVWVRKRLSGARQRFTELLLDEVERSLERPTRDELEEELIDLGLLEYCRDALERKRGQA